MLFSVAQEGAKAVAHKASRKEPRCWAEFPVPAPWVLGGAVVSSQVAGGAVGKDALQGALQSGGPAGAGEHSRVGAASSALLPAGSSGAGRERKKNCAHS